MVNWVTLMELEQYWMKWTTVGKGPLDFTPSAKAHLARQLIRQGFWSRTAVSGRDLLGDLRTRNHSRYLGWTLTILDFVEPEEKRVFIENERNVAMSPVVSRNVILVRV